MIVLHKAVRRGGGAYYHDPYRADLWDGGLWVVSEVHDGDAEILSEWRTLREARAEIDRLVSSR